VWDVGLTMNEILIIGLVIGLMIFFIIITKADKKENDVKYE